MQLHTVGCYLFGRVGSSVFIVVAKQHIICSERF